MRRSRTSAAVAVDVTVRDEFTPTAVDYARTKIGKLAKLAHEPVLAARVRLTRHGNPAVARPVIAQANLDVNGRLVRAQVAAPTAEEAIDRLGATLRQRLARVAQHWEARRGRMPGPDEWRHISEPAHRPGYFPRPPAEREIVRHKSFTVPRCTVDDAAAEMELLDYDFHLFTESGTGHDSVLYRAGTTGYRLAQPTPPEPGGLATHQLPVTISPQPAPALSTGGAVERLTLTGLPFLFFVDPALGRARVLYHRYDGHYGLITPAA
ncbi:HPF/RaiA family ribosome-associated protein [Saccharomonospora sp. NPDC046836]|uniref:ribosome hibernation promotion factor n=1 Tax=Saccharomonospora sp. NPDC046836 TaxID=3156921 RepID=UPI00341053EE